MKKFSIIQHSQAGKNLIHIFGEEYFNLDEEGARLVRQDWLEVLEEEGISPSEYLRRIGSGNLYSYAKTMKLRMLLGWNR